MANIGVFTTIKVIDGVPLFFDKHKTRILSNAKQLELPTPDFSLETITDYIKKNNLKNCALKIIIKDELSLDHRPLPQAETLNVITVEDTRNALKTLKTTNRIVNNQAKKLAEENGADDALFVQDTFIIESTYANIFSMDENGNVITPPLDGKGLKGIARQVIMERIPVKKIAISKETNQPLVLVNSLRVQPIKTLDGRILPDAKKLAKKLKAVLERSSGKINYRKLEKWIVPENVFQNLFANEQNVYWLDSSLLTQSNRFSYMGKSSEVYSYFLKNIRMKNHEDVFSVLQKKLDSSNFGDEKITLPFDFMGGYVGYFGYELKVLCGAKQKHNSPFPDSLWFYSENFIAFDHLEKEIYLVSLKGDEDWFDDVKKKLDSSHSERSRGISYQQDSGMRSLHSLQSVGMTDDNIFKLSRSHDQYIKDIETCKDYLNKGESYQICLTNNIHTKLSLDPFSLYQTVRKNNPAPFSLYLKHNDLTIICSSPEQFLSVNKNRIIETKPIKGTIRRGKTSEEDTKLIKELKTNNKEWSENAMIVDLLRNDLGKVCEFGSVEVSKLMDVESYATVHQLVSTIRGKLREDISIIEAIKACFPGGSMTGVPKIRTMEILDSLETEARGIYSGAIGFLSLNNTTKLNIAIRTIVMKGDEISIGAGGAIVTQSDPEKEYNEMMLKAKVLMESIELTANKNKKVFLALGSNVGDKKENIEKAIKLLGKHVDNISVAKIYESEPMYFEDQDVFNNTVLLGYTKLSPEELLNFVKETEKEIGRIKRFPNGPREIDIDILFYDDLVYKETNLEIPHPKIAEREFVLKPFMDLEPEFVHPVLKKTMKEIYESNSV